MNDKYKGDSEIPEDYDIIETAPIVPGKQNSLIPVVAAPPALPAAPPQLGNYFTASLPGDIQHDGLFVRTGYQTAFADRTPLMPVGPAGNAQNSSIQQTVVVQSGGGGTIFISGMRYKGIWNAFTNYQIDDVVTYLGFLYVSITAGTNQIPVSSPAFWTQIAGLGSVTSVAMTVPSIFLVAGSPITTTGTLAVTLQTQNANKGFFGPATGADAIPTFRALVTADLPAGTGTVTSVALSLPVSVFTISGSPVMTTGTLTGSFSNQAANTVFAGPASGGAAVPTFRQLAASELSNGVVGSGAVVLAASPTMTGTVGLPIVTQTGKTTTYNNIATVDNGVPSELGNANLTGQTAAKAATTLYTPAATGRFRISIYLKVTTAASVSSVLGPVTITYTDGTDSVAQSVVMALQTEAGAVATTNVGNLTTSILSGTLYIYALTAVPIQYAIAYTSVNAAEMAYAARLTCEAM